jgi:hypothetical protein
MTQTTRLPKWTATYATCVATYTIWRGFLHSAEVLPNFIFGANMETASSARALVRTIEVGFLYEDGATKGVAVEWSRGITVLDALKTASHKPHGIRFCATGDGRSAFVTEIDGQTNDMSGNWMYWVNGELATVGCGEYVLRPSDIVRWEFVPFDPKAR